MTVVSILSKEEVKYVYSPPLFNHKQRTYYFKIPPKLVEQLTLLESDTNITIFILNYGYFKATHQFYSISNYNQTDIDYIANQYHLKYENKFILSTKTHQRYKRNVKEYLAVNDYTATIKELLEKEAIKLANNFMHRKKIFHSLVQFSKKLNIEIPSYTELSRIITVALNTQKKDILEKLTPFADDERMEVITDFLEKDEESKNRYNIAHYRRLEHSTKKNQILLSLGKFNTIKSKFAITKTFIDASGITPRIAQYYAQWIEKAQTSQLTQTNKLNQQFTLLSFIYYQYLIRTDNLVDRFIATVQSAKNSSFRAQKDYSFEIEPQKNRVMQSLENVLLTMLDELNALTKDSGHTFIEAEKITKIVEKTSLIFKSISMEKKTFQPTSYNKYNFIEQKSISLQGKLSGIVKSIEFDELHSNKNLILAINHFKNNLNLTNKAPKDFLTNDEQDAVFDNGKIRVSLYKALLFFHVSDALKNGRLTLKYSYRFRNLEDYFFDKNEWTTNKDMLLNIHELEYLKDYDSYMSMIKTKVESSYKITNENIKNGFNTYFTATDDSFILKTPKVEKEDENNESIAKYFPQHDYLSVIDILNSIDTEVDFLASFSHFSQSKITGNHNLLLAAILGYGCNLNITKIGKISKGINENQLDNTKIWYFTEENTIEANDKILAYMDTLPIIKEMRANQDINHTSSDGQKYNLDNSIDSTNAGTSFKYFGMNKGVVSNLFLDEAHRLFHSQVINVTERESENVIDGLMHNDVVKSDIHSTDTIGFSEIIFCLTNFLGVSFAPRIKNFKDQQLYSFNTPKFYHNLDYKVKPKRKINEQLIKDNWDDILRFIITILERKTTATQLLKRLNSYSNHHKLYAALKELGRAIKTDFLLIYIDDVVFRQAIEKQLNKSEAANKFSKAVFFGNNQEFQAATVEEQNIANNCKRLIQNAIILWNYLYITKKIQDAKTQIQKDEIMCALKNSSIVHWSHINFYGEYNFNRSFKKIHNLITIEREKDLS